MIVDQQARELISRHGLDRTLFVEAGAGTGKTSQLVARIVNLVADRGVPLTAVAAITFTDAAAAELRDRVRVELERRHHQATDDTERDRCRVALADVDLAAISTLHGFAQRILSEHPTQSGLPPRIGVLDEISSDVERDERWERFVDGLHDDPANEELLVRASLLGIVLEPAYEGQPSLREVAARLGESWDRLGPVAAQQHPPLGAVDFGPFDRAVESLASLPDRCSDPSDGFYCHLVERLLPELRDLAAIDDPHAKLRALGAARPWGPGNRGRASAWNGDAKAAKAQVESVNEARDEVIGTACHQVLVRLRTLIARDLVAAAESRRVEGRLEFHDLLVFAVRLLATSRTARDGLHRRYRHLLLDEFQDTDPLQIRLAVMIAAAVGNGGGDEAEGEPSWSDAAVPDGRLFFVGDPKQSIYRFRRADIELFLAARDTFGRGDALQHLTTNFRTVAPVIDWLNQVFSHLMPTELAGMQPAYEPLHPHRSPSPLADHRPLLLGHPHDKARATEVRHAEADDVARVLATVRDTPEAWPVADDDAPGGWRPARLCDVTILIPTRTELGALTTALSEAGVAYHLSTGTLVYDTQEVRDALSVLAAVDDPSDELALVAALRSPLYGCSDRDLLEHRHAGGRWDLRRETPAELGADHPVAVALAHLRSLWDDRWWVRPSLLLHRLLIDRRAVLVALGSERPAESWSRLRYLLDQARHFEESRGGDLRAFLQWAERQRSETVTVHQPVGGDPADDAVSITTIHGSKGLEFPIAVVAGTSATPRRGARGANVVWDTDDGLPGIALRKDRSTLGHRDLADREREMEGHEQLRLLYVACTRGRDHLVVTTHHRAGNGSFAELLTGAAATCPDRWRTADTVSDQQRLGLGGVRAPAPEGAEVGPTADQRRNWIARRHRLLDEQGARRHVSATALARSVQEAEAAPVPEGLDAPDDHAAPEVEPQRRRGRAGTAIGRAVHATLQLLDLADPDPDIESEAGRQADNESIPEHAGTVAAMVRSALASVTVRTARIAHREIYVAAPVGEVVLEGYIDLLAETDDGLVIVDYKTDTVRTEAEVDEKLAAYELQGAAYAVALEAATGLSVVGCRFVFCRPDGAIERSVTDLGAAKARVRRHLGAAEARS
ncbi:MAG: UvrD-helicase domain-containing protein [Acidimicrobiales bacterium]